MSIDADRTAARRTSPSPEATGPDRAAAQPPSTPSAPQPVDGWVPEDREPFEAIACDMLKAGIGREGLVGAAQSYLFDATDIVRFGVEWIETKLLGDLASE